MTAETAFRSDDHCTQDEFRRWLDDRPQADINHYELLNGRIVTIPPGGWLHGRIGIVSSRLDERVTLHKLGSGLDSSVGYDLPSGATVEPEASFISAKRFATEQRPVEGQFLRIIPTLVVGTLARALHQLTVSVGDIRVL